MANSIGKFISLNDITAKGTKLDVARMLVRVPTSYFLSDYVVGVIDGNELCTTLREDSFGSICFVRSIMSKSTYPILSFGSESNWSESLFVG